MAEGTGTLSAPDWREGLEGDAKGYVESRGWKTPGDLTESYRQLEKTFHAAHNAPAERVLTLPEKADDVEGWGGIWQRLGRPKEASGYEFPKVELAEGAYDIQEDFRAWAFEAGMPKSMAESVVKRYQDRVAEVQTAQEEAAEQAGKQVMLKLESEWGEAYDANVQAGREAGILFGLDKSFLEGFESGVGTDAFMRFMTDLGKAIKESGFESGVGGRGGFQAVTPVAAQEKIDKLMADESFLARYNSPDQKTRVAAATELLRLQEKVTPG